MCKKNKDLLDYRPLLLFELLFIRILHECEVLIEKSVPRVTVWHHEAPPSDAKL